MCIQTLIASINRRISYTDKMNHVPVSKSLIFNQIIKMKALKDRDEGRQYRHDSMKSHQNLL